MQQRLPSDSGRHTPASLPLGVGGCLYAARLLPFGVDSILCSVSGRGCTLEPLALSQESSLPFFYFLPLVIPQLGLLSHVGSLRLCSGHLGLVLTLSSHYAVHASLSSSHSLWWTGASGLLLCWHVHLLFFFLPVVLPSEILKLPTDLPVRGFPTVWKLSPSRLPPQDRSPSLTLLSLLLSFMFCPTSFRRERAAFLDAWCPLPAFRSCFVEVDQHSNALLMNLWGR